MARANLKPRRVRGEQLTGVSVELKQASNTESPEEQRRRVAFPWTPVVDSLLDHAGFLPGQRVYFSVDYRSGVITIALDRNYTIAGRQMTEEEIRQRGGFETD
jgi:toxic protein SymE